MSNIKLNQSHAKAFEILCNIVDAYYFRDKKLIRRKVLEAVVYMESRYKTKESKQRDKMTGGGEGES